MHARFRALGDPTRCAIVERLARGPATVGELAVPHQMSLPAITKHLAVLEAAGLIQRERTGRHVHCALQTHALEDVASWADRQHRFWTEALARLDDEIAGSATIHTTSAAHPPEENP